MQTIWTDTNTIMWRDCLATGKAGIDAICNYWQEAAWHHADHLGFGFEKLRETSQAWVLVRLSVEMDRYPGWGGHLTVKTWPVGVERVFARRDFIFLDEQGIPYGRGASWWVILDPQTRQVKAVDSVKDLDYAPRALDVAPARIRVPAEAESRGSHTVQYIEVDQHNHVNNTRYASWILNAFGAQWNSAHELRSYDIEFLAEAFAGDQVEMFSTNDGLTSAVKGVREADGREIFRAKLRWEQVLTGE